MAMIPAGPARQRWPELSRNDVLRCEGSPDRLIATLMERYGKPRPAVEREVEEFLKTTQSPPAGRKTPGTEDSPAGP